MTGEEWPPSATAPSGDEVAIDYLKSPDFHTIRADGAIGGVTPYGAIHMALYSERHAIPRRQVYKLDVQGNVGRLGPEVVEKQVSRGSIVRDMSVDLFITPEVAERLGTWLLERVAEVRNLAGTQK